ncbi:MAG: hypothetical protein ACE5I1_16985, partial [bacterium]
MAQKYLFVAEVDKIQEMLFRFSRQRQVLGGSRLLAHFCDEMEKLATKDHDAKVHTSMGGSFRISFDENHKDGIDAFEEKLALFYRLLLDGSLTSAGYLAYDSDDAESFCKTNRALQEKLRRKKEADKGQVDVTQASIIAFCQNSGSGLAIAQGALLHRENENNYLSKAAMDMGHAGGLGRYNQDDKKKPNAKRQALDAEEQAKEELQARKDDSEDNFLNTIREKIIDDTLKTFYWPRVIDEIGRMDPLQNNVAYVLADANGMGKLFGECESPEELETLSQMLDETIREAVAWPVEKLHTRMQERMDKKDVLPLLPLIVAGDDVFVLLPACYALDYAQHFCLKFQDAMSQKIENHATLKTLQNKIKNGSLPSPSISAAVVFCKTKYPYHLAHKRGEELLRQAKTLSKGNRDDKGRQIPSLAFEMIMGNQLVKAEDENGGPCTPTMNPYWLTYEKMG